MAKVEGQGQAAKMTNAAEANPGDNIDPRTLPPEWDRDGVGGGWVGRRYFCFGCHKDGYWGWRCTEIR